MVVGMVTVYAICANQFSNLIMTVVQSTIYIFAAPNRWLTPGTRVSLQQYNRRPLYNPMYCLLHAFPFHPDCTFVYVLPFSLEYKLSTQNKRSKT